MIFTKRTGVSYAPLLIFLFIAGSAWAQTQQPEVQLSLPDAVEQGLLTFERIKAKQNYYHASMALSRNARNEYLPNVIASAQQSYGTVNGQFGPAAAIGVLGLSSAGPPFGTESWNSAFGAMYILNTNWEVFSFGRLKSRIALADAQVRQDSADLLQEQFQHSVRVASAYLNLLVAQRFVRNAQSNLSRAEVVRQNVRARVLSGLNPGVDSSLANADASRARISLVDMQNNVLQSSQDLAVLLNTTATTFQLDTTFLDRIPSEFQTTADISDNPQSKFFAARINQAQRAATVARRSIMPGLTLFGIYQARGSGFQYNYTPQFPERYSQSYTDGVSPDRHNYVAGFSIFWNLLSPLRVKQQARAQEFVAEGYRNEYNLINTQLQNQLLVSDQRISNSLRSAREVPLQFQAASDAYLQKSVLYKNGLTNLPDLQLAMYALNRAELDRSVAFINVWQALLLKAAATGDFDLFINQAR
ncbi:TolC family protein [Chryseolinea sp. T2]|uniref:TolC family protein n=1 Tax=Chryseolinea sp. T2 TaxID=3129255 RepID=UPI003077DB11